MNKKPAKVTDAQFAAVRHALADLIGAYQAWEMEGTVNTVHDWEAHLKSIDELAKEFHLQDEVPDLST